MMRALLCAVFLIFLTGGSPCLAYTDIAKLEQELAALEAGVADPTQNAQSLLERFSVIAEQVKPGQTQHPDLENRMSALVLALLSRVSKDVNSEARQRIESSRSELAGYTGVEHLEQIKAAKETVAETKREIIALSENPETQFIQIEDDTRNALISFERDLLSTRDNICTAAAKAQCFSSLPDFPEKYRNMLVSPGGKTTILDIACAAKHRGFYQGFSAGGVFSNDIVLKLEMATIYFKEQRLQRETHRPVGSGYTGDDTYTILVATKIETEKGAQEVKNSSMEMLTLSGHMGGIPNVKECE